MGSFSVLISGSETGSGSRTLDNSSLCPLILYQPPSSTAGRQSTASHPSRVLECQLSSHNCPYVRELTQASDLMPLYNGLLVMYSVLGVDTCSFGLLIIFKYIAKDTVYFKTFCDFSVTFICKIFYFYTVLKVTFHLQLSGNIGPVPCAVLYDPSLSPLTPCSLCLPFRHLYLVPSLPTGNH